MASTTITFIRHAKQTTHRKMDPPIQNAPPTFGVTYDHIICSPYLRCRQTANYFRSLNPIIVDVRISEYQGKKKAKESGMDSSSLIFGTIPPTSEEWPECQKRLDEHWLWLSSSFTGNILVITHGVVVNYLHEKISGKKLYSRGRDVPFGNGFSVSR